LIQLVPAVDIGALVPQQVIVTELAINNLGFKYFSPLQG
jgi:hypothetical protein